MSATSTRPLSHPVRYRLHSGYHRVAQRMQQAPKPPIVLLAGFAALRVATVIHAPIRYPDTQSYLLHVDFLGGQFRLWTVPLSYHIFSTNWLREVAQLALGIVAWSTLAMVLYARLTGRAVRLVVAAVALLLGLVPQLAGWDALLLSESESTSLFVLLVALLLRLDSTSTLPELTLCFGVATLWAFTRQTNAICYLAFGLPIIFVVFRTLPRQRAFATGGLMLLLVVWAGYDLSGSGTRSLYRWNSLGIVVQRVATDPVELNFFYARGLPRSPDLITEAGHYRGIDSPLWQDPRMMHWIDTRYRATYISYMFHHPSAAVIEPFRQALAYISSPLPHIHPNHVLPGVLSDLLWAPTRGDVIFYLVVTLALVALALAYKTGLRKWLIGALLVANALFGTLFIWHAAPGDFGRMFLPVGLSIRLGMLILIAFAVDGLARLRP